MGFSECPSHWPQDSPFPQVPGLPASGLLHWGGEAAGPAVSPRVCALSSQHPKNATGIVLEASRLLTTDVQGLEV